jgi:hypothetical protein
MPLLILRYHYDPSKINARQVTAITRWHDLKGGSPVASECDGPVASARIRWIRAHTVRPDQGIDRHQGIPFIYGGRGCQETGSLSPKME